MSLNDFVGVFGFIWSASKVFERKTNDFVFYSDVKKTQVFSLTAADPKLIPTHPKSLKVLSLFSFFSFFFTILNIQTRGFQLYCSPQPDSD